MYRPRKLTFGQRYNRFITVAEEYGLMSPLVQIGQFKELCKSTLLVHEMDFNNKPSILSTMSNKDYKVSEEVVEELAEVCSPSSLSCPLESSIENWEDPASIPENTGLVTLDHWRESNNERRDLKSKSRRLLRCKYSEISCAMLEKVNGVPPVNDADRIQCPELIITVTVFFPRDTRRFKSSGADYLVLGSQKLSELRDKIPCAVGEQPIGNFTDNPGHPTDIKIKDIASSSLFLIEKTFYSDMRLPSSIDLSSYLVDWASTTDSIIPKDTECVNMDDVTFNDLFVRFGCPYLFLHLGECEHIVIFKDVKLFNSSDCQSRVEYPITISRAVFKANPCDLCCVHLSVWITMQDELALRDPAIFCDSCFRTMHYDKQGNKLGKFIAFPRVNIAELDY